MYLASIKTKKETAHHHDAKGGLSLLQLVSDNIVCISQGEWEGKGSR